MKISPFIKYDLLFVRSGYFCTIQAKKTLLEVETTWQILSRFYIKAAMEGRMQKKYQHLNTSFAGQDVSSDPGNKFLTRRLLLQW